MIGQGNRRRRKDPYDLQPDLSRYGTAFERSAEPAEHPLLRRVPQCHQGLFPPERRRMEVSRRGLFPNRTPRSRAPFARRSAPFGVRKRPRHPRGDREIPVSGFSNHLQRTAEDRQDRKFLSHLRHNRVLTLQNPPNFAFGSLVIHRRLLFEILVSAVVLRRASRKSAGTRIRRNRPLKEAVHKGTERRQPKRTEGRGTRSHQHARAMNRRRRRKTGDGERRRKHSQILTRKPDDHAGPRRTRFRMTGNRNGRAFGHRKKRDGKRASRMRLASGYRNRKKLVGSEINS